MLAAIGLRRTVPVAEDPQAKVTREGILANGAAGGNPDLAEIGAIPESGCADRTAVIGDIHHRRTDADERFALDLKRSGRDHEIRCSQDILVDEAGFAVAAQADDVSRAVADKAADAATVQAGRKGGCEVCIVGTVRFDRHADATRDGTS